jgi:hypothetical protein
MPDTSSYFLTFTPTPTTTAVPRWCASQVQRYATRYRWSLEGGGEVGAAVRLVHTEGAPVAGPQKIGNRVFNLAWCSVFRIRVSNIVVVDFYHARMSTLLHCIAAAYVHRITAGCLHRIAVGCLHQFPVFACLMTSQRRTGPAIRSEPTHFSRAKEVFVL